MKARFRVFVLAGFAALALPTNGVRAQALSADGTIETKEEIQAKVDSFFATEFRLDPANGEIIVPTEAERAASPVEFGGYLMELAEQADRATERGEHALAAKLYRAMAKAVPGKSVGFVKLCESYEAAGDHEQAIEACAAALSRTGVTSADFLHYAKLMLTQQGELSETRIKDLDAVAAHLGANLKGSPVPAQLRCDIGARLMDAGRLSECTHALQEQAPNEPKTLSYLWTLALVQRDFDSAQRTIERAKQSGMKLSAVQLMERVTADARSSGGRAVTLGPANLTRGVGLSLAVSLLLIISAYCTLRQRRALGAR
jgi:tetratricopeptide (TPR) repeat protein